MVLRHEVSSPARTLREWIRILLETWIRVYGYFRFRVALCRQRSCDGLIFRSGFLQIVRFLAFRLTRRWEQDTKPNPSKEEEN